MAPARRRPPTDAARQGGAGLRALRLERHLSQTALAFRLDLSVSQLQNYEAGRSVIRATDVPRWAKALETSREELVDRLGLGPTEPPDDDFDLEAAIADLTSGASVTVDLLALGRGGRDLSPASKRAILELVRRTLGQDGSPS